MDIHAEVWKGPIQWRGAAKHLLTATAEGMEEIAASSMAGQKVA